MLPFFCVERSTIIMILYIKKKFAGIESNAYPDLVTAVIVVDRNRKLTWFSM